MVHAEEIFPAGCKPFVTQDAQVSIPKGKSGIIMVHYGSLDPFLIQTVAQPGAACCMLVVGQH